MKYFSVCISVFNIMSPKTELITANLVSVVTRSESISPQFEQTFTCQFIKL